MLEQLKAFFAGKSIVILGFGVEGKAMYRLIRRLLPEIEIVVADGNEKAKTAEIAKGDVHCRFQVGENYTDNLADFDMVIKSPGISMKELPKMDDEKLTSQTELFIRFYRNQIIGITGTKGKSTTSSLIYHLIKQHKDDCVLVGNIGTPPFEIIDSIGKDTIVVYELSSHQLEHIKVSPHVAILLNFFQEHLDHYASYEKYQEAKFNIALHQAAEDFLIYNYDDALIRQWIEKSALASSLIPFSLNTKLMRGAFAKDSMISHIDRNDLEYIFNSEDTQLKGRHNFLNIMAAVCAAKLCIVPDEKISIGLTSFQPLAHRIEFVGTYENVYYYNDSISTIPEATMAAVNALKDVDTLILGGFDRGIFYDDLMDFVENSAVSNVIFIDEAGKRMRDIYFKKHYGKTNIFSVDTLKEAVGLANQHTAKRKICLLSPAAASYGMFKNFEERGEAFKQIVRS